jgi:type II secretory pathway pseudopilin PulG
MKKGAMFGFCRVLRKQFGELFLTSRQSEAPQGANDSIKTKRGAMFGLDARIALAIFGALSVISGAALYSAIQNAKVTALTADISEVQKALEAFYLDTGTTPSAIINGYMDLTQMIDNDDSIQGWNGPYLQFSKISGMDRAIDHPIYGSLYYIRSTDVDWVSGNNWGASKCSFKEADCYIWTLVTDVTDSPSIIKALDIQYDGVEGSSTGNFRWYEISGQYRAILKHIAYK